MTPSNKREVKAILIRQHKYYSVKLDTMTYMGAFASVTAIQRKLDSIEDKLAKLSTM